MWGKTTYIANGAYYTGEHVKSTTRCVGRLATLLRLFSQGVLRGRFAMQMAQRRGASRICHSSVHVRVRSYIFGGCAALSSVSALWWAVAISPDRRTGLGMYGFVQSPPHFFASTLFWRAGVRVRVLQFNPETQFLPEIYTPTASKSIESLPMFWILRMGFRQIFRIQSSVLGVHLVCVVFRHLWPVRCEICLCNIPMQINAAIDNFAVGGIPDVAGGGELTVVYCCIFSPSWFHPTALARGGGGRADFYVVFSLSQKALPWGRGWGEMGDHWTHFFIYPQFFIVIAQTWESDLFLLNGEVSDESLFAESPNVTGLRNVVVCLVGRKPPPPPTISSWKSCLDLSSPPWIRELCMPYQLIPN